MSREILDSVWSASGIRLIGDGVPAGDVMAAQASLTHWNEWFPYWTGLGDTYERLAREALARNRRQSAGERSGLKLEWLSKNDGRRRFQPQLEPFAVAVDGTGQKVALPGKPPQRRNRTRAIAVSLQTGRHSITGFLTQVGRGFTPRQAGRKGPPY